MLIIDLFEDYENLPKDVSIVYWKYSEIGASEGFTYDICADYQKEMEALGYTFDYGLDAEPYDLRKITN